VSRKPYATAELVNKKWRRKPNGLRRVQEGRIAWNDHKSHKISQGQVARSETEATMSNSISTLLLRNLSDVFGENDPVRRRAAIDEIFHEDAVFYDAKGDGLHGDRVIIRR
jgi:hypothetical protein